METICGRPRSTGDAIFCRPLRHCDAWLGADVLAANRRRVGLGRGHRRCVAAGVGRLLRSSMGPMLSMWTSVTGEYGLFQAQAEQAGGDFTFRGIKDEREVGATSKRQIDHSRGRVGYLTSLLPSGEEKWLNPRYAKFRCRHPAAVRAAGMDFEGLVGGCALFCTRG